MPYPTYSTVWRGLRIDSGYQNDEWGEWYIFGGHHQLRRELRASVLLGGLILFFFQSSLHMGVDQLTTFFIYHRNTDFNIQDFSGDENANGTITFSSKSTGKTYSGTYALERIAATLSVRLSSTLPSIQAMC